MKSSISSILGFLSIQTLYQDGYVVLVSGFQVLPPVSGRRMSLERSITQSIVPTSTKTRTTSTSQSHSPTTLYIFGGLFGGGSSSKLVLREEEPLIMYSRTLTTDHDDDDKQYEALQEYIEKWSKLFTNGNIKLTTPVTVELVQPLLQTEESKASQNRRSGIRLLFKDTNTGYKTKSEEKESNNSSRPATVSSDEATGKKEKKGASKVKQGGVEILVEKNNNGIQVTAKRCEIEEDTIIKEMSEETILNELKQAIEVWKRETQS